MMLEGIRERASIAGGPIYQFDEVFEDPQVQHLGLSRVEIDRLATAHVIQLGSENAAARA